VLLDERQILRIDHFLGKEPSLDILFLRFREEAVIRAREGGLI
jgi:glucose-6-phosphate 1-dehydrogenase